MYRVRNGWKPWRTRWPWNRMFPLRVDERFCRKCQRPDRNGPLLEEDKRYTSGNVVARIYQTKRFGIVSYRVQFSRWISRSGDRFLSPNLRLEDFHDLAKVATQAHKYMDGRSKPRQLPWQKRARRSAHR